MKGYKVFNPDWTCRGFQYEVGKTFEHKGHIGVCNAGFHFCKKAADCFNYYSFDSENKVAEIEALGIIKTEEDKSVTDKIHIIRELSWIEVLELVNTGKGNEGRNNSGQKNVGDYNTEHKNLGDCNTGSYNRGCYNSGDYNVGNYNTGSSNVGNCNTDSDNTGHENTGKFNVGNNNTGDFNITNNCSGVFCIENQKIKIFDKESDWTFNDWRASAAYAILRYYLDLTRWIDECDMTEDEKNLYPSYKITNGYLKTIPLKEAFAEMWETRLDIRQKEEIMNIPNFDKDKFMLITGIDVDKENKEEK